MRTITGDAYRITFLTSRLIRLEYQAEGFFEDMPTTLARRRDFPDVPVISRRGAHGLEADTEHLHLVYNEGPFSPAGLSITVKGGVMHDRSIWHYGEDPEGLGGTARTLDGADGAIEVGPGLMSFQGFSVLDDSASMLLTEEGSFQARRYRETDLYFFGYGHDYAGCLKDFYALSGEVPLLPRYALGNWWSRYHAYTEESYLDLMRRFQEEGIPLSVAVIDMDWHITKNPYTSGWTGYTWNRSLFPDPARFLAALHAMGLHTTLNLHPAEGVGPHEEVYAAFCDAVGKDKAQMLSVDFDAADERFMQAYFRFLHHPLEKQGVDFWWIDWQQGTICAQEGLDPLWVLNERHYRDLERNGKRALILSRYAGPGSHRCPVGFSGDTVTTWASLQFQPAFTAMASNIGYPWWSHDIGGHMRGIRSDELSVRWLQYGVFSPILRLHSSKSDFMGKEPWSFGREAERIMIRWLRFRHRLIPYLYTAMERTHRLGEPLVRPMYYLYPEAQEAYRVPGQYLFGPSLMVCPLTEPMESDVQMTATEAWLPEGRWFDCESGRVYTGGRMIRLWRSLEDYAALAPAGAVLPLADSLNADENPREITLRIFGGADGHYVLYEDDGISRNGPSARTHIDLDWQGRVLSICTEGNPGIVPEDRQYHIELFGTSPCGVTENGEPLSARYDEDRRALCFTVAQRVCPGTQTICFDALETAGNDWLKAAEKILRRAQTSNEEKEAFWRLLCTKGRTPSVYGTLKTLCSSRALLECLWEVMYAEDMEGGEA